MARSTRTPSGNKLGVRKGVTKGDAARKGLYRSRWGNYDLVLTDGLFTLSEGLVGADLLASRLQGQDVARSGFYDVVRDRLGWPAGAEDIDLPSDLQACLV
jgi:hypothetical protein